MSIFFRFIALFVAFDDKQVLLSSMSGDNFSGSPKVLYDAMKLDERFEGFHYVWAFSSPEKIQIHDAKKVKIDTFQYFIIALRSKIWITDVNIERGLHIKNKKTIYLNTWHGTGPKKGGNAVKGRSDYDFSNVDIFCCDGQYTHDVFMKWWNVKENSMLWSGRPREDELLRFTCNDKIRIREQLGIPSDKKVILYMPTWRENANTDLNYSLWKQHLSDRYVMIIRAHHFSKSLSIVNDDFIIDGTNYSNVNELYLVADILISDYSSAFFDFGLLNKPMFCYAYDYDEYKKNYGLFMDLEDEFPNGVFRNEKELILFINDINYSEESEKVKQYVSSYILPHGNATKECLDKMAQMLK